MKRQRATASSCWALLAATALACRATPPPDTVSADRRYGFEQVARSRAGMLVSASPLATRVGAEVLGDGGNAVDAAVATAFALSVVEPSMSGLGGRTQILLRTADGQFVGLDGGTEVPRVLPSVSAEEGVGYGAIGIPGTVAALVTAAREYGSLPLARLVQPAIVLASRGYPLSEGAASRIASVADVLVQFDGSRRHFLRPDGSAYLPGDTLVQSALAAVLQTIADSGAEVFYRGWIADSMAADLARHGGSVTRADLDGYDVRRSLVVGGSYRGLDLVGTYLPASGATTIEALHIMERFDLAGMVGSAEWMHLTALALLTSFDDRVADFGRPDEHARLLVSKEHAVTRAEQLRAAVALGAGAPGESPFTTHLSVVDRWGGMVALTQSVGPTMGSKVVTPGLGFVYAATMGYLSDERSGDRPWSSQSPMLVLYDGRPWMVVGASGARRIISALVSVISRVVDGGATLQEAMGAPRFHPTGGRIYVEMHDAIAWDSSAVDAASAYDFELIPRDDPAYFAAMHGIAYDSILGVYIGVADPRRSGSASGPH